MAYIDELGMRARTAKRTLTPASATEKNRVLEEIAKALTDNEAKILEENEKDIARAKENGISDTMVDRLRLTPARIQSMSNACRNLVKMEDPVGAVDTGWVRPNGLRITRTRVPMGVIGIIFESRPNVTVDAAALCIKSGNVSILRGGKEAIYSNTCLAHLMQDAAKRAGMDENIVQLVEDTSREIATQMMQANDYIDVLIPRGGAGLIQAVVKNATVPVIETGTGNCHVYVDQGADLAMALDIVDNGKTQRPSVCNAVESCLVAQSEAETFLPMLKERLDLHQVEIRGCEKTKAILGDCVIPATKEDYATEFLDYIISVKVVKDIDEAVDHIMTYTTGHSECIVTENIHHAEQFKKQIDAAAVYVNCSTRFTDGEEFGLGAEIGISTQKLHARGPMGLRELTTVKYIIEGEGQIRP